MSENDERMRDLEDSGSLEEPEAVPLDLEVQQGDLEAAGWERMDRMGKIVWRHPESGHLYPQGAAISRLRRERRERRRE